MNFLVCGNGNILQDVLYDFKQSLFLFPFNSGVLKFYCILRNTIYISTGNIHLNHLTLSCSSISENMQDCTFIFSI